MKTQDRFPFRLVIVSNRGPYRLHATRQGLKREKTIGGLVTAMLPVIERLGGVWIAWGEPEGRYPVPSRAPLFDLRYIELTREQVQGYYHGLANNALWPLCHYFPNRMHYDHVEWELYEQVNRRFAQVTLEEAGAEDVIWVHDYHLARLPFYIREQRPSARILFFWHIPFPAVELFRTLPWRRLLLESLLACDEIGFHIPEYAKNFTEATVEILGARAEGERIHYAGRTTQVLARPIGIDFEAIEREARSPQIEERVNRLRQTLGEHTLIFGIERMDYTKGILERLRGIEYLLEHQPEWHDKFTLIQVVTPSRMGVEAYRQKKREIDEAVGRINGRFSNGIWVPIRYLYRTIAFADLIAYYRAADIALITPLRDGLNLVAKEYVASRIHGDGVLVLSEFAGVAYQLPEALLVNPYSAREMATALEQALDMSPEEQRQRMAPMRSRIQAQDMAWWTKEFLNRIA